MRVRELLLWTVLAILAVFIWYFSSASSSSGGHDIAFADFMKRVDAGTISDVVMTGDRHIVATSKTRGERLATDAPADAWANLVPRLVEHGVQVQVKPGGATRGSMLYTVLYLYTSTILPWFTFILILVAFVRLRAIERRIDTLHGGGDRQDAS